MGKGSDRERQYVDLCNRAGMGTYRPATVRFGENDVMGLFDVLAFSPAHSAIHAVQVKSNRASGIRAWAGHTALFRQLGMRTFYAVPYDREGWRLIECRDDGRHAVVDERELSCNMGERVVEWLEAQAGGES
jgi:Holliday junction resolvase